MGLDMYAYRVRKLTDKELAKTEGRDMKNVGENVLCIPTEEIVKSKDGSLTDLIPYMRPLHATKTETDFDQIKRDYDVPDDWELCGCSYNGRIATFRFCGNGDWENLKVVNIHHQKCEEYERTRTLPCMAVYYEQVAYWRKEYLLEDALYEAYDGEIINCGFHLANEKMKHLMLKYKASFDPDDTIFYHEWY